MKLLQQLRQLGRSVAVVYEADFFALNHQAQARPLAERLRSLYPVWTECSQFEQVIQYLLAQNLAVYGTDPMLTSDYSQQQLVPYLDSLLPAHAQKAVFLQDLKDLQQKTYFTSTSPERRAQFLATLHAYHLVVSTGFDHQLLRTIEAFAHHVWQGLAPKHDAYYRDQAMGDNLFWLTTTALRDQAVVFFGANIHIGNTQVLPAPKAITTVKAAFDAHQGAPSYALAMIAYEGVAKRPTLPKPFPIPAYMGQGLEQSLHDLALPFALINLRAPDLRARKFYVRGFGHATKQQAVWSQVYDAFLYTQLVEPCGQISK
ncbi:erythromycin esterase family protein [Hymenobacter sp. BT559]|nr:erythromycin esterase family protein [Hymenobacter sp. BT559]